jgi:hypothetical protein
VLPGPRQNRAWRTTVKMRPVGLVGAQGGQRARLLRERPGRCQRRRAGRISTGAGGRHGFRGIRREDFTGPALLRFGGLASMPASLAGRDRDNKSINCLRPITTRIA